MTRIHPTFTRRNLITGSTRGQYSDRLAYEPTLIGGGANRVNVYQRLSASQFWRKGETIANQQLLESLITQQKLNDYRGGISPGSPLKYYQGTFIGRTADRTWSPVEKIMVDYSWTDDAGVDRTYTETASGITNGLKWNVKRNEYNASFYIPNQGTDQNSQFFERDIELISPPPPDRGSVVDYGLTVTLRGVAASALTHNGVNYAAGDIVPDSVIQNIPNEQLVFSAVPGTTVTKELVFTPATGLVTVATASTVRPNTDDERRPAQIDFPITADSTDTLTGTAVFTNQQATLSDGGQVLGGSIVLPISVLIPNRDDFEDLHIDVSIDDFAPETPPGIENINLTIQNNIPNVTIGQNSAGVDQRSITIPVSGSAGQRRKIDVTFTPIDSDTHSILPGNINTPVESGTTNFVEASYREQEVGGNSTNVTIEYEIPAGGETGATLTFSGSASAAPTTGIPVFGFSGTFAGLPTGVTIQPPSDSSYSHRGAQDATFDGQVVLVPDEGQFLTASGFSQDGTTSGVSNVEFEQSGDNVVLKYTVRFGSADITGRTINISAGTSAIRQEPYSLTFILNNIGVFGGSVAFNTAGRSTHRIGYVDRTTNFPSFNVIVTPEQGMAFAGTSTSVGGANPPFTDTSNEIAIDVAEQSAVDTGIGTLIELDEQLVTVTQGSPFLTASGQLVFTLDVNPNFLPSTGGNYVMDINITGASNYNGQYSIVPEANRVLYTGVESGTPSFRTARVEVATQPVAGRIRVVSVTPSTSTATVNTNGSVDVRAQATASATLPITFTAVDTTVVLEHLDDQRGTPVGNIGSRTTIVASETLSEEEGPATTATITNAISQSANGGSNPYVVTADGAWETILNASPTDPTGRFRGSSIIYSFIASGGAGTTSAEFSTSSTSLITAQQNLYLHIVPLGSTTRLGTMAITLTPGGGVTASNVNGYSVEVVTALPASIDSSTIYIVRS